MFKWLKYLTAVPALLRIVRELLDLIRHAEDLIAGGSKGAAKKALVIALLTSTVDVAKALGIPEADQIDKAKLTATAGVVIDTVVGVLNSLGIFKHGSATLPV